VPNKVSMLGLSAIFFFMLVWDGIGTPPPAASLASYFAS
jgi:hypothetical protein